MLAVDLISWAQTILLHDHPALAKVEPKTLRYRLLRARRLMSRSPSSGRTWTRTQLL